MIRFDFSKAFDHIERDILWAKLYEEGRPIEFVRILRIGHEGNTLRPKRDGYIGKEEINNKGAPQGIPLSVTPFIIYDERMMGQYELNIAQNKTCRNPPMLTKDILGEFNWAQYRHQLYNTANPHASIPKTKYENNKNTTTTCGALKFPDDTAIIVNNASDIYPKLQALTRRQINSDYPLTGAKLQYWYENITAK